MTDKHRIHLNVYSSLFAEIFEFFKILLLNRTAVLTIPDMMNV